jgi:hypothetical protein
MQNQRTPSTVSKKTDQISVRLPPETMAVLREIHARHGLIPTEPTRRLIESAVEFYRKNGWFGFPVEIYPHAFNQAAESAAAYGTPKKTRPPRTERKPGGA